MNRTQFVDFVNQNWRVIAILLVAVIVAVIALGIFSLPAQITHSGGAITNYTNNSSSIV